MDAPSTAWTPSKTKAARIVGRSSNDEPGRQSYVFGAIAINCSYAYRTNGMIPIAMRF